MGKNRKTLMVSGFAKNWMNDYHLNTWCTWPEMGLNMDPKKPGFENDVHK